MVTVLLTGEGQSDFDALPVTMQARVLRVFERLQHWPKVSGARPLRGEWQGHHRIRAGDWRVIFRPVEPDVLVVRIRHRSEVYEGWGGEWDMESFKTMTLDGRDYVLVPISEYRAMQVAGIAPAVDAIAHARASIGHTLRAAREAAGLTQAALAKRLRKSQPLIARAESGDMSVGERYVAAVLRACGLPETWKPGGGAQSRSAGRRRPPKEALSRSQAVRKRTHALPENEMALAEETVRYLTSRSPERVEAERAHAAASRRALARVLAEAEQEAPPSQRRRGRPRKSRAVDRSRRPAGTW
jgi:mRNA interferase RelE/StbE